MLILILSIAADQHKDLHIDVYPAKIELGQN